jgi:hypothetical protein
MTATNERTYTVLRVAAPGTVPLRRRHVERLGHDSANAFTTFANGASAGIYRVWWDGAAIAFESVAQSRLREGMAVRFVTSPYAGSVGAFRKRPSGYEAVRVPDVASLLTDASGGVLHESCSASIVAWDGRSVVLVPDSTPRVASVAEAALAANEPVRRAPIETHGDWPLLLCNAVVGTCAISIDRPAFPPEVRRRLDAILSGEQS